MPKPIPKPPRAEEVLAAVAARYPAGATVTLPAIAEACGVNEATAAQVRRLGAVGGPLAVCGREGSPARSSQADRPAAAERDGLVVESGRGYVRRLDRTITTARSNWPDPAMRPPARRVRPGGAPAARRRSRPDRRPGRGCLTGRGGGRIRHLPAGGPLGLPGPGDGSADQAGRQAGGRVPGGEFAGGEGSLGG